MVTSMFLGHLAGAIYCAWKAEIGHSKHRMIQLYLWVNVVSGASMLVAAVSSNLAVIGAMLAVWCFACELVNSFINMVPLLFFRGDLRNKVFALQTSSWALYSVLLPGIFLVVRSWRWNVVVVVAVPSLVLAGYLYLRFDEFVDYCGDSLDPEK